MLSTKNIFYLSVKYKTPKFGNACFLLGGDNVRRLPPAPQEVKNPDAE